MNENFLSVILSEIKAKYTNSFANNLFFHNPDRDNFYGLSYMLSLYGVQSKGYKSDNKTLAVFNVPFVAQTDTEFVLVKEIIKDKIIIKRVSGYSKMTIDVFYKLWTGNALVFKNIENAVEPDYKTHRKEERLDRFRIMLMYISSIVLISGLLLNQREEIENTTVLYFLLNALGLVVSNLLLKRQIKAPSIISERICDFFHNGSCDDVSKSQASRIIYDISWSEVGVGFFLANIIVTCFYVESVPTLGLINLVTIPFTIWSIWYQFAKLKKWCPLCVIVQMILWGLCVVVILSFSNSSATQLSSLALTPVYIISVFVIHHLASLKEEGDSMEEKVRGIQYYLCRKDIFFNNLKKNHFYQVYEDDSRIVIGNTTAEHRLTVVSNPLCVPCSNVHKVLSRIIQSNDNVQVRYIFSSHKESLILPVLYVISSFLNKGPDALNEWYNKDVEDRLLMLNSVSSVEPSLEAEQERLRHNAFIKRNSISWTPTILIDGYRLPQVYSIEDLEYLLFE